MKLLKDNRGFSLIELIVTIAIMGILAGAIVANVVIIGNANSKKAAQRLGTKLDTCLSENLTKLDNTYLYIFKSGGEVKTLIWKTPTNAVTSDSDLYSTYRYRGYNSYDELMAAKYTKELIAADAPSLGGNNIDISVIKDNTETDLPSNGIIKIGFDKADGSINTCVMTTSAGMDISDSSAIIDFDTIRVSGRAKVDVKLVHSTGKHTVITAS
ncbi:MAG: type II secretion system GspH family protein [Lachnospiraceae bacterium]|nr:type II secretion system GspH family protein [Lachnospiraceae bacterium]